MMMVLMVKSLGLFFIGCGAFNFTNPPCRACYALVVEETGVNDVIEVHHGVIGLNDGRTGLKRMNNVADAVKLVGVDLRCLVEDNQVAEFNLLDE